MHEQNNDDVVESLTGKRSKEILNDKVKMDIIEMLRRKGPSPFGDIIRELKISQQEGTSHILELKLVGLIDKSADPPNYNINPDRYQILMRYKKR